MTDNQSKQQPANRRDIGFWRELWQQGRLVWRLMNDSEVPFYLKFLPLLTIFYLISPFDFLPGIPLDDVTAIFAGMKIFIELVPPHIVAGHLEAIRQQDWPTAPSVGSEKVIDHDRIVINKDK